MGEGRRRVGAVCLVATLGLLAGCIGNLDPETGGASEAAPAAEPGADAPRIELVDRNVSGPGLLTWNGSEPSGAEAACANPCEAVAFRVEPSPTGDLGDALVVSATWDPYAGVSDQADPRGGLNVTVHDATGTELASGPAVWWSAAAVVEDPEPGHYTARIEASQGPTAYQGVVHLQDEAASAEGPARELLPDLVSQPVIHLTRESPMVVRGMPGGSGCDEHERVEHGAENCLRFTTSIGNLGQGPLELRMSFENATRALARGLGAPVEASFTQAIHRTDGSRREVAIGQGEFHAAHHHYHKEGFASFTIYAYDVAAGERGEAVREGHKSSWCLVDMGLTAPAAGPYTEAARYPIEGSRTEPQTRSNCALATPTRDMVTGISPGWYDMYEWHQPDQYVEVTGLEDGTYELVTRADPDDQLRETDPDNNAAGVVFEWADGEPRVIERWSTGVER